MQFLVYFIAIQEGYGAFAFVELISLVKFLLGFKVFVETRNLRLNC